MPKKKVYIVVFFVLVMAFFAGNFAYPQLLNLPFLPNIPFKLGLDLQGGIRLTYEADLAGIQKEDYRTSMEGLRDLIERRIRDRHFGLGVEEPLVQVQEAAGRYRLVVELAGVEEPAQAIEIIGQTPYLEFKEQRSEEETQVILDKQAEVEETLSLLDPSLPSEAREQAEVEETLSLLDPSLPSEAREQAEVEETLSLLDPSLPSEAREIEEIQEVEDWYLAFEDPYFKSTPLTGRYLKKAQIGFDQMTYTPLIFIEFDNEGAKLFEELTEKNIGKLLAIYIDGMLISAPVVQDKISGGSAQITGDFTVEEARTLARNLSAGALPVPIDLIFQQTVGPTLGKVSLENSLKAGMLGFLAIVIFMLIFYKIPGILASLALIIYISLILTIFKVIPVTLTLAGIAGFILSVGMAIDANILIFSRMREEIKEGKNLGLAIEDGFNRAWLSIRDGNVTTLIVAAILFFFGTSFIKGFASTLILGILISMFSAIVITKNFLRCFKETKLEEIKWLW